MISLSRRTLSIGVVSCFCSLVRIANAQDPSFNQSGERQSISSTQSEVPNPDQSISARVRPPTIIGHASAIGEEFNMDSAAQASQLQAFGPNSFSSGFEPPCFIGYVGGGGSGEPQNCEWHASSFAGPNFVQPQITNVDPFAGTQHLRLEYDPNQPTYPICLPDFGADPANPDGTAACSAANNNCCRNAAFTNTISPPPAGDTVRLSLKLRINGTPNTNASYFIHARSISQGFVTAVMMFKGDGSIVVADDGNPNDQFFNLVDSGFTWAGGVWKDVTICVDNTNDRIRYFNSQDLVWSTGLNEGGLGGGVFFGTTIDDVILRNETNIADGVAVDVDDVVVEPGNCPEPTGACCNFDGAGGCQRVSETACQASGTGSYGGNNSACEGLDSDGDGEINVCDNDDNLVLYHSGVCKNPPCPCPWPFTIGPNDLSFEGADVVVDGTGGCGVDVRIDGEHSFNSIAVINGGVVSHTSGSSGMMLNIATNVFVDSESSITSDGRGYEGGSGPGAGTGGTCLPSGGGYGGAGGAGQLASDGGDTYGAVTEPEDLGSGGGSYGTTGLGGRGGGAIRLTVGGTLQVEGSISSNGTFGTGNCGFDGCGGAGGSGGSVWLTAATLSGTGFITSNGGLRYCALIGGGGGGRIAVYYDTSTFSGPIAAQGGNGYVKGGAGTIYVKPLADLGTVYVDNGGQAGATTEFSGEVTIDGNLVVSGQGIVGHPKGQGGFHLTVTNDVQVMPGGHISSNGRGYAGASGPGAGTGGTCFPSGGGYGGAGGAGQLASDGGDTYGSVTEPVDLGSGGGTWSPGNAEGGGGGGAIRLTVGGTLQVDGIISSDGVIGTGNCGAGGCSGGGGSGGSVWLTAATLAGTGMITAKGGPGYCTSIGGGGGGKIAVYYDTSAFSGPMTTQGGNGYVKGGAGTIYVKPLADLGTVYVDNGAQAGATTEFSGEVTIDGNLVVSGQGIVGHPKGQGGFHLTVTNDVQVMPGGHISSNGRGYAGASGPGAGTGGTCFPSGGGYGGAGGAGQLASDGGDTYGSVTEPVDLGSGGGTWSPGNAEGGGGGGAIRLTVGGTLQVDGIISSDGVIGTGNCGAGGCSGGGGSGGSVWLTAATLAGTGMITAKGGPGYCTSIGGGGGGRIAIYPCEIQLDNGQVVVQGGDGWQDGFPGTVFYGNDSDADGVCDSQDVCPGGDDNVDSDQDGTPDFCDPCPLDNPNDTDGDGVCESQDVCPGQDDSLDADMDTAPDACDNCQQHPNTNQADCDDDGMGDVCALASGSAEDCNDNDVPDFCDIADGTSDDNNANNVPDECDCPTDLTGDGVVNAADLALLLGAWGANPGHPADINGDGVVNAADLALLLGSWGPC